MIPEDLEAAEIPLDNLGEASIVLITGGALRHRRLALRMREAFGDRVVAWFVIPGREDSQGSLWSRLRWIREHVKDRIQNLENRGESLLSAPPTAPRGRFGKTVSSLLWLGKLYGKLRRHQRSEKRILGPETARLGMSLGFEPQRVADPRSEEFLAQMKALSPDFIVTCGGPLLPLALLSSARCAAINQHAGWSPNYKGAQTVDFTLYHRDLDHLGATVHLMASGADSGPILRRSHPCLLPWENAEDCFTRVVALGNELLIEALGEAVIKRRLIVFPQAPERGRTFLAGDYSPLQHSSLQRDFSSGWLAKALAQRSSL
ncbi:MAG: hypothetical protein HQL31_05555 [Planctomycetes bacterium]|nr:hypothetical protein [Planctomycetota bacterium]